MSEDTKQEEQLPPMTMSEARASICRMTAAGLQKTVEEMMDVLANSTEEEKKSQAADDMRLTIRAARELAAQLILQARKLDRPLILQPDRSLKLVRH